MTDEHRDNPEISEPVARQRRDTRIEQLERALADEREHAAALRKKADELAFQNEILERSYSKQLEDARAEIRSGNEIRDEQAVRIADLDAARVDAIDLLEQARAEIDRLTAERERLRRKLLDDNGAAADAPDPDVGFDPDECSIDELMDDASWARRRRPAGGNGGPAAADREAQAGGDMLDPGLVFARDSSDD